MSAVASPRGYGNSLMLLPIAANGVVRGEYREEVRIKLRGRGGGQAAEARQVRFAFHVVPSARSLHSAERRRRPAGAGLLCGIFWPRGHFLALTQFRSPYLPPWPQELR
jgi:hypothetical protein